MTPEATSPKAVSKDASAKDASVAPKDTSSSAGGLKVSVLDSTNGKSVGSVNLDPDYFGIVPNVGVMHQVVTAQLGARRRGTHSTRTRSEVRGGGAKPWRQKGTGRARHGSIRSPQWRGGGVAHGPKPRDYSQRTPRKMIRLALCSALSDRAAEGNVLVVKDWDFAQPKTKEAVSRLEAIGADGKILLVLPRGDNTQNAHRSFANLSAVHTLSPDQLNCYDILLSDKVVFTKDSLPPVATLESSASATSKESDS